MDAAVQQFSAKLPTEEPVELFGGEIDVVVEHLVDESINLPEAVFLGLEL